MSELAFHLRRLLRMLRYRGLAYAARYTWFNVLFHAPALSTLLVNRLKRCRYPTCLEVEVTTRCNLRCVMCEHTYWRERGEDMPFEHFERIVRQFPVIRWIGLTGIGTAFLNKDFLKMLRYVKAARNPYIEIYDSATLLDETAARALVEAGLDRLIVSLDGATADTYENIRVGARFDRVLDNIRGLLQVRREARRPYPEVTFHYIISTLNQRELADFVRLVHGLNIGPETEIAFTAILHDFREIRGLAPTLTAEEIATVNAAARACRIRVNWNKNTAVRNPIGRCVEWTMPFIFVDGTVIPCCAGNEANNRPWQRRFALGNVFQEGFRTIWDGPRYRELRERIWRGQVPDACRQCSVYQTRS
jgi:MoaA/NifB/PqqE/SkfB family radical SAM enzyme